MVPFFAEILNKITFLGAEPVGGHVVHQTLPKGPSEANRSTSLQQQLQQLPKPQQQPSPSCGTANPGFNKGTTTMFPADGK